MSDVNVINCLFAEFDAKDFENCKKQALDHIHNLEVSPSAIIDSGGGYHCYWILNTPYIIDSEEKREQAVSFVYGNLRLSGRNITKEEIREIIKETHENRRKS